MRTNLCLGAAEEEEAIAVLGQEMDLRSCGIPITSVAVAPGSWGCTQGFGCWHPRCLFISPLISAAAPIKLGLNRSYTNHTMLTILFSPSKCYARNQVLCPPYHSVPTFPCTKLFWICCLRLISTVRSEFLIFVSVFNVFVYVVCGSSRCKGRKFCDRKCRPMAKAFPVKYVAKEQQGWRCWATDMVSVLSLSKYHYSWKNEYRLVSESSHSGLRYMVMVWSQGWWSRFWNPSMSTGMARIWTLLWSDGRKVLGSHWKFVRNKINWSREVVGCVSPSMIIWA